MNERIYELAEKAAEHALLNPSDANLQSEADGYDTVSVPKEFIDKLSELIIQDCRDMFVVGSPSWNLLNEKLGVEEC